MQKESSLKNNAALIKANQLNMRSFYECYAVKPEGKLVLDNNLHYALSGKSSGLLNHITYAHFENNAKEGIHQALEIFRNNGIHLMWWIFPDTQPETLVPLLIDEKPFSHKSAAGMIIDLGQYQVQTTKNIDIVIVENEKQMRDWVLVNLAAWKIYPQFEKDMVEVFWKMKNQCKMDFYLASVENQPVSTALRYDYSGVTGIYWVATHPDKTKKNYATHVLQTLLNHAKADGMPYAILQASPDGYPVYTKLGFIEHCQYEMCIF